MMKHNWNKTVMLLTVTTVLFGQLPGAAFSQGAAVSPVKTAQVKATAADKKMTFLHLKGQSTSSYTSNVSGTTPGYVFRFISDPLIQRGVDESHEFFYSVPQATLGTSNYLELTISHSELLIPTQSTLTVSVDDKPVKSIFLTKETSNQGKVRIPLGAAETTQGFHKITLSKHSAVSKDMCSDLTNPANWVKIEKSSFVFLDTKTTWSSSDLLKDFPHPFVEPGTSTEVYGAIVVPNSASAGVISSALQMATSLSSYTASHRPIPILTETEWEKRGAAEHVIAIGNTDEWQGQIQQLITANRIQPQGQKLSVDYFQMRANGSTASKLLMLVTGGKGQSLQDSIRLLTEPDLKKQLAGNQLAVQVGQTYTPKGEEPRKLTFSASGYSHSLLNQSDTQTNPLVMKIPSHWKITGDGTLDLKVKASPMLLQDETDAGKNNQLTVTVNGVPSTFPLRQLKETEKNSDWYSLSIPIPAAVVEEGGNALTISFGAYLNQVGAACSPDRNNGRWIFVDKESALNMPHESSGQSTFQYWPAPFVDDSGLEGTAFLLPENVNGAHMTQLSMLVNELVSETGNSQDIRIFREPLQEQERQKLASYNVIVTGDPSRYPSLQESQDKLLVNNVKQLAGYQVINETTNYVSWIQDSPLNEGRVMAVFESADPSMSAKGAFVHADLLSFLTNTRKDGQIAVMSKSGEVFSVKVEEKAAKKNTALGISLGNIPIWLMILIPSVILILLVVYIRMLKVEKKKATRKRE